ncbi:5'-methylthioadenosine/S-adenosylhomocysteine nucleosidase [Agrobacterium sp. Ap1]|uniref:5'-methylthioadenosine/S-adenosylhomocysteine nucleosidase n=1 Tax=Agrobacterium sp. Ap1 TaxID=2815337 RepID=UPI001A8C32B6|nr:5'-methylthioadenosine/S-adenosylhomocysteine nucleosidase [Agrobacterium sp. Ap1]MBO0141028.1 5'-methylthioadenosine/S-adenosylhomocysteine nucleosidase [Agrobacterium sp. Ap1]
MSFELTRLGRHVVLFVMAVDAEYGPHLKSRIKPLMTGVGPIEAAIVLSHALTKLQAKNEMPDLIVSLGSAGSRTLEQTEVYQASSVAYRDMDASPLGFEKGRTPFLDHPAIIPLPLRIPGVPEAALSTGGNIVSGAAYDLIAADMVDMETFAIMRCCQLFGIPLIGLRGISDGKAELKHVDNWTEYLHVIDEKLAGVIDRLGNALESGNLAF